MAYAPNRSMNAELEEGMTDGKYKKIIQNRGGFVDKKLGYECREDLDDTYYGIHETKYKALPDGTYTDETKNYVDNKEAKPGV